MHGRLVEVTPEYMVIEKTGHKDEITELLHYLQKLWGTSVCKVRQGGHHEAGQGA
ncbi:MAG: hypothetical protein MZV63_50755 [Marinilabiliales bacterium]|nr:hypothetical protein [Marinilabiliales bacterium]